MEPTDDQCPSRASATGRDMRLAVNSRFRSQQITGVQRYASSVIERLDAADDIDIVSLSVPSNTLVARADELLTLASRSRRDDCDVTLSLCNWSPVVDTQRSVVVVHDVLERVFPEYYSPVYRALRRGYFEALKLGSSRVVTVSSWSAHALRRVLQRDVEVVPGGVEHRDDLEVAQAGLSGKQRWAVSGPFLLFVGAHDPRKNVDFCEALLPWLRTSGYRLIVTARSGSTVLAERRPRWLDENPDVVSVVSDPSDADLHELYAAADVLLHPSRGEGFGLPMLEAYSFGTPFISGPVGIATELAVESVQVRNWDAGQWIESLDAITGSADSLTAAVREVAADYSWDTTANRLADICRDVASRSGRAATRSGACT